MVLSSGSKSARYQQSICNLGNTCGGVKKAGIAPRVGFFLLIGAVQSVPKTCVPNTTIQTQLYGYHATLGGV